MTHLQETIEHIELELKEEEQKLEAALKIPVKISRRIEDLKETLNKLRA